MPKLKLETYLDQDLHVAIHDYYRLNRRRFKSPSEAAAHQLRRALADPEGQDELIFARLETAVRRAVRVEVEAVVEEKLKEQTNRIAALLVKVGKYSYSAYALATTVLGQVTRNPDTARAHAKQTLDSSGEHFSREAFQREHREAVARRRASAER
jgi:predicted esterase YcpF (UPF0227 family)